MLNVGGYIVYELNNCLAVYFFILTFLVWKNKNSNFISIFMSGGSKKKLRIKWEMILSQPMLF